MKNFRLQKNDKYLKALASSQAEAKKKVSDKNRVNYLKEMADSEELQKAYAQKLVSKTSVGIQAQLMFTEFLNMGTVDIGEPLIYTLDEPVKRAKITEMAVHGGKPRETLINNADYVRVTPYEITSPEVSMSKFSLRQGDVSNEKKMKKRVEEGVADLTEVDSKGLLEAGLVPDFSAVDGINIDDRVHDFPSTNDLDLSAQGGLTLEVFRQITSHFDMVGRAVRNVYIPSSRRSDLWEWMSIPAGYSDSSGITADNVVPQGIHEQIVRTGTLTNLFGYPVNLVPINTLNGNAGNGDVYIWVATNQPAGEYREIPDVSSTYRDEDARRVYFTMNKAVAMFQTPNQKLNYARVRIA